MRAQTRGKRKTRSSLQEELTSNEHATNDNDSNRIDREHDLGEERAVEAVRKRVKRTSLFGTSDENDAFSRPGNGEYETMISTDDRFMGRDKERILCTPRKRTNGGSDDDDDCDDDDCADEQIARNEASYAEINSVLKRLHFERVERNMESNRRRRSATMSPALQ